MSNAENSFPANNLGLVALSSNTTKDWWDQGFTDMLLDAIPENTTNMVEFDCGLARTAHALLPNLRSTSYRGILFDDKTMEEAKTALLSTRFASRVNLVLGEKTKFPVSDESTDVVLFLMHLQRSDCVGIILDEAKRILKPGGHLIAVEPDNLGQRFYFDGVLEEITQTVHNLCLKSRVALQPADIAIGPRLPTILTKAGFHHPTLSAHAIHSTRIEDAKSFFTRIYRVCQLIAHEARLGQIDELAKCEQAINRVMFAGIPKRLAHCSHLVPVFTCKAVKSA